MKHNLIYQSETNFVRFIYILSLQDIIQSLMASYDWHTNASTELVSSLQFVSRVNVHLKVTQLVEFSLSL